MGYTKNILMIFLVPGFFLAFFISFSTFTFGQDFPNKPITIYCGYAAGASTDVTIRALAEGSQKLLGVPVIVENRTGGAGTVTAGLLASKKPDGYTLGGVASGVLTVRSHLQKLAYDPLNDFTMIMQYSRYVCGLCVHKDSPLKTIDEFIAYAKAHPGLSYSSPGMYSGGHLGIEVFKECKGLTFKHVPTKGGAEANTQLLGKHVDFVAGAGQHIPYLKQGVFRMLMSYSVEKRHPKYPDVPTLLEIGCSDPPPVGYVIMGPKGIPQDISKKLGDTFRKVAERLAFQKILADWDLPYDHKDRLQLEKEIPADHEWYKNFLKKVGVKKED